MSVLDRVGPAGRALLAVLNRDGEVLPSDLRANYDFTMDLEGSGSTPEAVRAVLNIEIAMRELDRLGLAETYYTDAGLKKIRLTPDGRTLLAELGD